MGRELVTKSNQELLDEGKKRWKNASDAMEEQARREEDDLKFQDPDFQWDPSAKRARQGQTTTNIPVPARPIVTVDKLSAPVQNVVNQFRQAHLGINIHPLSPTATDKTAEVLQGIYRHIERRSKAQQARNWGFDRSAKCGTGWYRVGTEYDTAGGHPFDQVITIDRILYQQDVRIDPAAQKPDFSDANYGMIGCWVSQKDFKRQWPKASFSDAQGGQFTAFMRDIPDWVKVDGAEPAILVVEQWYKEWETKTYVALKDGRSVPKDEVQETDEPDPDIPERDKADWTLWYCKLDGVEVLEEPVEWNGRYIPLIPFIGRELQPFDEQRRRVGIIGPAKDAQRGFNWAISTATERAALEPKAPWVGYKSQFTGMESWWQQANNRNFPYLPVNEVPAAGGGLLPLPQRVQTDSQTLSISLQLTETYSNAIMATTQAFDPSLGQGQTPDQSGKAIQGLQGQSDLGNSHYIANAADITMSYEATVVLDMIPHVYDRPGRLAWILTEEGESELVMLNQPHVVNPKSGQPVAVVPHPMLPANVTPNPAVSAHWAMPPQNGQPAAPIPPIAPTPGAPPAPVQHYDLREGAYGVEVTIGKSQQSRLDQGAEFWSQVVQANPELMTLAGDIVFRYRDDPGSAEMSERLKDIIAKQHPEFFEKTGQPPDPEALQSQLRASQQQIQQLQQQLQQAQMEKQGKVVEQQGKLATTQAKAQSDERIALTKAQSDWLIEKMKAETQITDTGLKHGQEHGLAAMNAAHDVAMQQSAASKELIHSQVPPAAPPMPAGGVPPFTASDPRAIPGEPEGI